jgi:hypothetical protein
LFVNIAHGTRSLESLEAKLEKEAMEGNQDEPKAGREQMQVNVTLGASENARENETNATKAIEICLENNSTPFEALKRYYWELPNKRMYEFVESLRDKFFDEVAWEALLKFTLDDYKELHKTLGSTLQIICEQLLEKKGLLKPQAPQQGKTSSMRTWFLYLIFLTPYYIRRTIS